tara:strand:- start:242 stop:352 length:111 start_codon:yes stop_codon:yes gene_type:complete
MNIRNSPLTLLFSDRDVEIKLFGKKNCNFMAVDKRA